MLSVSRPYFFRSSSAGPDSPNVSFTPIFITCVGAFSESTSHTALPSPPIGNVSDSPKIYVEDNVDTFFLQLSEKSEKEKQPEGAFLIGEMQKQDNEEYIYIYGAKK